jgi:hypothetical protein
MLGERFLVLQEKARLGTLKNTEIIELLSAVARLRAANALLSDELRKKNELISSLATQKPD